MKHYSTRFLFLAVGLVFGFLAGRIEMSAHASPGLQEDEACSNIETITDVNETLKCLVKLELDNSTKLDSLLTRQQRPQAVTIQQFLDSSDPLPEPIILTGTGPSVIDLDKGSYPALAVIEGGSAGQVFSVIAHDASSDIPNPLVTAFDVYKGIRPLDVEANSLTTRLEVEARGDWSISILPVTEADVLTVPGTYEGEGDAVLILEGIANTATISGGAVNSLFAVFGHGGLLPDPMVTAFEPYEGQVVVEPETVLLEIQATDTWSVTVE